MGGGHGRATWAGLAGARIAAGAEPAWRSYLRDVETVFPGFRDKGVIADGWAGYDALAPHLGARYAQWRAAGAPQGRS